jgi:hypothetical protein
VGEMEWKYDFKEKMEQCIKFLVVKEELIHVFLKLMMVGIKLL